MKTKLTLLLLLYVFTIGCKDSTPEPDVSVGAIIVDTELEDLVEIRSIDDELTLMPIDNILLLNRKLDSLTTFSENPFADYLNKKVIDQPVTSQYDISSVVGHIYKMNKDGTFSKVSKRIVKGNAYPKVETVNKIYYNDKLIDKKSIDIAITILNLNISKNETFELIIKDEVTTQLPDSLIDGSVLKILKQRLSKTDDYEKYYYAYGATLSSITFKRFSEQSFKKKVALSWITTGGEVYGSQEKFQFKSEVALEMIKLKDYIPIE